MATTKLFLRTTVKNQANHSVANHSHGMSHQLDNSLKIAYLKSCCKPAYRVKWLKNKGAILIIIWSYLISSVFHLLRNGYGDTDKVQTNPLGIILAAAFLFFPIGGFLADVYFGKYKMIRYSMWIMWTCVILITFSELLAQWSIIYHNQVRLPIICILAGAIAISFGGFQSNIVQFGISQLSTASTIQITSFITWYVLTLYISGVTLSHVSDCVATDNKFYIKTFTVAVSLTVAIISDLMFHQWLIKEQAKEKSIGLIFKVIKFTIQHRHSNIYGSKQQSRFNVAKIMYGGPFSNQQVEDVKSILRIVALIAVCSVISGGVPIVEYATNRIQYNLQWFKDTNGFIECYKRLLVRYSDYLFTIGFAVFCELVIFPIFSKCLPHLKISSRFLLGMVLFLFHIVALLGLGIAAYYNEQHSVQTNTSDSSLCTFTNNQPLNINYKLLLIPEFMSGLSSFVLLHSAIEFIWAQTPYTMTGLAFGTMYACIALCTLMQAAVAYPFLLTDKVPWQHYPLTCQIWYFFLQVLFVLFLIMVVLIAFKKYKNRTRSDHDSPLISSFSRSEIDSSPFS